ncbi:hypothetical protein PSEUBRA_001588 [Kalmanozyma brasiliensis GHG001]|uniref:uncharacterized protein n=1 Tax=Kalmanozyma brasiliensis (strain GHG001) TaxID=1365824 RepID=UPI002867D9EE|nr:uncharacterized protein PSEUBRA_001588 [Kalmanozyma brasiliensis GHG001]KAF6766967.1 hypothetical protein PSEUBRA_001588 [Kalmanozyma brasiliensis GHG001]
MTTTVTACELQLFPGGHPAVRKQYPILLHGHSLSNKPFEGTLKNQHDPSSHIHTWSSQPSARTISLVPTLSYFASASDTTTDLLEAEINAAFDKHASVDLQRNGSYSNTSVDSDDTLIALKTPHHSDDDADYRRRSVHFLEEARQNTPRHEVPESASRPSNGVLSFDPSSGHTVSLRDQDPAPIVHVDDSDASSDISEPSDLAARDDIFSCLQLKKHLSSIDHAKFAPDAFLKLMDDYETQLSLFLSISEKVLEALQAATGDRPSKLEQRVIAAIRRTMSYGLESMIMLSWFREYKIDQASASVRSARDINSYGPKSAANVISAPSHVTKGSHDPARGACGISLAPSGFASCTRASSQRYDRAGINAKRRFQSAWNTSIDSDITVSPTVDSPASPHTPASSSASKALSLQSFLLEDAASFRSAEPRPTPTKRLSLRKIKTSLRSVTSPTASPAGQSGRGVRSQSDPVQRNAFDPATLRETRVHESQHYVAVGSTRFGEFEAVQPPIKRPSRVRSLLRAVSS